MLNDQRKMRERTRAQAQLMVAGRAVVELEAAATGEAVEELREVAGEATLERVPALVRHRVVGVVAVVEALPELGVGEDLVGFVDSGHFGFGAAFVGMGEFGLFAAEVRARGRKKGEIAD